jgi:inner membrane protein
MGGPNHVAGGVVFTGIYLSMFDVNIYSQPHFLFFTAFFSLLPDIDHTKSLIGKPFFPLARYLDRKSGHRTITHSLLCYFLLALVIGIIEKT